MNPNGQARLWTREDVETADRMNREGVAWMQIWRQIGRGRGSNNSLRVAVTAYRTGWREKHRPEPQRYREREIPRHIAAAILAAPPPRIRAQLACLPRCELGMVEWGL